MIRSYKILIIGACMEVFVLSNIVIYHVFLSHAPYSTILVALGNVIHPILFGGVAVLLAGTIIFFSDKRKIQKI